MNQTICFSNCSHTGADLQWYKFDIELLNTSINIKVFNTTSLDLYEGSVNEAEIYVQPISKFYKMLVSGLNKENNFNFEINNLTDKLKCQLNYLNEFVDIEEFIILNKKANNKAVEYHLNNKIEVLEKQVKLLSELLKNTIEHKLDDKIISLSKIEIDKKHLEMIKTNGMFLQYIPDKTYELCLEAVKQNGNALNSVPVNHKTYEICLAAVKSNPDCSLSYVPEIHKTYELCLEGVKQNGNMLYGVPENHKTYELCLEAVKNNYGVFRDLPEQFKSKIQSYLDYRKALNCDS